MNYYREVDGHSLFAQIIDDRYRDAINIIDGNGNKISLMKVGYIAYSNITYCILELRKDGDASKKYIFKFVKISHELLLVEELTNLIRTKIIKDFTGDEKDYYILGKENADSTDLSLTVRSMPRVINHMDYSKPIEVPKPPKPKKIVPPQDSSNTGNEKAKQDHEVNAIRPKEQYVKSKVGSSAKKGITIAVSVSYALLLIMGILFACIPNMSKLFSSMGICDELNAPAYGITIGVMWVALSPAIGYYFATLAPVKISNKSKTILAVLSTVLLVAMNVVFFIVINKVKVIDEVTIKDCFEGSDSWFIPFSMVFASLGISGAYGLLKFKVNTADSEGDNKLVAIIKKVLAFKEVLPEVFILIAVISFTWLAHFLAFIVAIVIIAIVVIIIMMFFAGLVRWTRDTNGKKAYTFTNDRGCEQTVYSSDGVNFYSETGTLVGKSDGNGHIELI